MDEMKKLLRYGSKEHEALNKKLYHRLKLSKDKFSGAHEQMARNEEQFRAYIPESDADKLRKTAREGGMPQYTTIEVPYSYAQILATHTYITSVFLSRDPVLQYAGRHGESQQQEQCVEALMAYQMQQAMVQMYIWLLDPGKFGYGVVGHYWEEETVRVKEKAMEQPTFMGLPIPGLEPKEVWKEKEIPGYVGNRLYNVRPQDFFPDPRVPLSQFQRGEFCARYVELTWAELHEGQRKGKYFNLKTLREKEQSNAAGDHADISRDMGSDAVSNLPNADIEQTTWNSENEQRNTYVVKGYEIYVRLIPKMWQLGTGDREEIWIFTKSSSGVVIGAQPLPNWHGKFGFDIIEDEVDGYNLFTKSSLEMMKPLNDVMSWLVNTHFYNVRAALNNQFVFDPSMVVAKDFENPNPGKLLRLKPTAYGRDVRSVIAQLPVADVTRSHLNDMGVVAEMIQRATGVNDNIMGLVNQGGRKTATETRSSSTFGVNRLKTKAEYYSAMGFMPMSQKLLQNSQQFYSLDRKYRMVGSLAEQAPDFVNVTPDSIAGFFDFVPVDGTLPVDRFAQANLWATLLGQMRNFPQVMQTYDISKIFGFVAGLGGIKNVSQFKLQVIPNEQALQNAQAGNSIPMTPGANLNEPGQIPGMGATG
ncbi:portal protein [Methylocaldum sp.]|uniref:portal protein n=1 Tax=Methylocaldum sp. TaxID=1969727 RepID=UPI002D3A10DC|nr:hypothetical protein [Methylocaldum sp.]HYE38146.1 hypothetical protein [Methylocaldum sp.]